MATFTETRNLVGNFLADDFRSRNRADGFEYPLSLIYSETGAYPGIIGQDEVKTGIVQDLGRQGLEASLIIRNRKSLFRVSKSKE